MQEENQLTPILDVPPELILEVAVGVDTLESICQKYGYSTSHVEQLRNDAGFKARVAKTESDLQRDGFTHKYRAAYGADIGLQEMIRMLKDPTVSNALKVDIYKELVKTADLVPKQNVQQQAGGGYSITINIPQVGETPGRTIEMNRSDEGLVALEDTPVAGPMIDMADSVNRNLNSSLELPEDYQDE